MSTRVDHAAVEATVVPRAKLRPGASTDRLLIRPRLRSRLDEVLSTPVTVVVGPAGWGKTSLLASWSAGTGVPVAWLTVDETDRDAAQLWRGVVAALQQRAPHLGSGAVRLLDHPGHTLSAVDALLTELEDARQDATVLVVDDVHLVDEAPAVEASLTLFLQHVPRWLHVVVLSRRTPPLPVRQMRVRGLLEEISYTDLRFSPQEATELVTLLEPDLRPHEVEAITARADGWAAMLRLAASATRRRRDTAEAAVGAGTEPAQVDHSVLSEYVWREVFAHQDRELVDVLVDTSVVARLDASLGERLTGRSDVTDLLTRGEDSGLFVTRIGDSGWYEVHALVREVLRAELERRSSGGLTKQHTAAAEWFADDEQTAMALEHWLLAGKPREALRLLADNAAALYDQGREGTMVRVMARISDEVVGEDVDALIEYAWCHLLVDRHLFCELVARASQRAAQLDRSSDGPSVQVARLRMLEGIEALVRGDLARCAARTREAIDAFGARSWSDFLGRFASNMVARDIALTERWEESRPEVDRTRRALSRDAPRGTAFEGTRALGEALAGHPERALRVAARLRREVGVEDKTILRIELSIAEAIAHRELGERTAAIRTFLELVDEPVGPVLYARLLALLELTGVRLDEGDLDRAERMFGLAANLVGTEMYGPDAHSWLARAGTVLALRSGRLGEADGWAGKVEDGFWSPVSRARVLLAQGDLHGSEHVLAGAVPRCERHSIIRDLLRYRLAVADSVRPDDEEAARALLLETARRGVAHGVVQTVAAEGPTVLAGLDSLAWQLPSPWHDRVRRAAQVAPYASVATRLANLVDPLTGRELDVLTLLPTQLTLREIADRLSISPNTLKTHLRSIYRKLDCGSRPEAADIARSLKRGARTVRVRVGPGQD